FQQVSPPAKQFKALPAPVAPTKREARDRAVTEVDVIWARHRDDAVPFRMTPGRVWEKEDCEALCRTFNQFEPDADRICEIQERFDDVWLSIQCDQARYRRSVLGHRCATCTPPE